MNKKNGKGDLDIQRAGKQRSSQLRGSPVFPAKEDAFGKYKEKGILIAVKPPKSRASNEESKTGKRNGNYFQEDVSGVLGLELEDDNEGVGSNDEENSYYGPGPDGQYDSDEDKGEQNAYRYLVSHY